MQKIIREHTKTGNKYKVETGNTINHKTNESTAGADASVEVPKLHNIKLLIASFYTHMH